MSNDSAQNFRMTAAERRERAALRARGRKLLNTVFSIENLIAAPDPKETEEINEVMKELVRSNAIMARRRQQRLAHRGEGHQSDRSSDQSSDPLDTAVLVARFQALFESPGAT
jgi:hypothetical protein